MAHYVVETYLSNIRPETFQASAARARRAAAELSDEGVAVRHLRSVFLAEDETCFHFFEAPSIDAVQQASERAGIATDRIAPSLLSESAPGEPAQPRAEGSRR
jgi:hypothetical protein